MYRVHMRDNDADNRPYAANQPKSRIKYLYRRVADEGTFSETAAISGAVM
jgi:hypothetical protein